MRILLANLVELLHECARKQDIVTGRATLSLILEDALFLNAQLICLLIKMFAACGNMLDALHTFNTHEHDVYTWSCIILAHAHHGYTDQAFLLYHQMQITSVKPNTYTFVAVIKACGNTCSLDRVYCDIIEQGLERDRFVGNSLVDMYARHGNLVKAQEIFDQIHEQDVVSWSAMINGYTSHGQGWEAINLFHQMWHQHPIPDEVTFLCILKACSSIGDLTEGKVMHIEITKWFELGVFLGSTLIDMYGKCSCMDEARKVFDGLSVRNVVCWNAIIAGYVNSKDSLEVMHLLHAMQQAGFKPNEITFTSMLKACTHILALKQGMVFHDSIVKESYEIESIIGNSLVDMYVKCGSLLCACMVFDKLAVRSIVSWNAMISGHVECGHNKEALKLYYKMQQEGTEPDSVTFLCMFKACIGIGALEIGRVAYSHCVEQGLDDDMSVGIAVVDTFAKCGNLSCARKAFDLLPVKNVVLWSALISGYVQQGCGSEAFLLLENMQQGGIKPNDVTFVSLLKACLGTLALDYGKLVHTCIVDQGVESISTLEATLVVMYTRCGSLVDAREVFDQATTRDVVLWSAMVAGYTELGYAEEALHLYKSMQEDGAQPNEVTFACMLKACASLASLDHGKLIYGEIMRQGLQNDLFVGNTLVDMFAKCGSLENAHRVFKALPVRDVISWSAMIEGYANHGYSQLALDYFHSMQKQGIKPVDVTCISVLSACCNAGFIDEGHFYFTSMKNDYGLIQTAEHYACLVDLLGRAGQLNWAKDLVLKMPIQSDPVVWMSLLGSCARFGNVELGKHAYYTLINFDRGNATSAVLLANIYAANAMWEDARRLQSLVS